MSQRYEDFAKQTYRTFYKNIEAALTDAQSEGKPLLVISGEEHNTSPEDAYSHIAGITAAIELVGKENVIVSAEIPPEDLENFEWHHEYLWGALTIESPMNNGMRHALENDVTLVATDVARTGEEIRGKNIFSAQRLNGEIEAISSIPDTSPDTKIIFHIGGTSHLFTLSGYRAEDQFADFEDLNTLPQDKPFEEKYGQVVLFNSWEAEEGEHGNKTRILWDFATAHANAIQIKNPGLMDEEDKDYDTIVARIKTAAENYRPTQEVANLTNTEEVTQSLPKAQ